MLEIFRTNQFIVNILLLFYAGVLHLSAIIWPDTSWAVPAHGVLADWVYGWVGAVGRWPEILATLLVFVQAVILNAFFSDNRLTREFTLFPGLFYLLVASALPDFLHLSPLLMANTFYLLAFREAFSIYRRPQAAGAIFNAGFWVGLASLFYFSFVIFLVWGFVALNIMRAFRIRERFMILIGLLVPYILLGVYYFYTNRWADWIQRQFVENFEWLDLPGAATTWLIVQLVFLGLILLVVLLSYGNYASRQTIDVQKKISLMYWGLFLGGLSLFFQADITIDHAAILAVPMGMLLSLTFVNASRQWAEAWHLLLLAAILFLQYRSFFLIPGI